MYHVAIFARIPPIWTKQYNFILYIKKKTEGGTDICSGVQNKYVTQILHSKHTVWLYVSQFTYKDNFILTREASNLN